MVGTPRGGASVFLLDGGYFCCTVSKKLISWDWWVDCSVLANVSDGGFCKMVVASSVDARSKSKLSSLGNGLVGNHIN